MKDYSPATDQSGNRPWGVYLCKCVGCGCDMVHVAHVDDVESGRAVIADGLCTICSCTVSPSDYCMSLLDLTSDKVHERVQRIGIPDSLLGDDGKVSSEHLDEFTRILREYFGKEQA